MTASQQVVGMPTSHESYQRHGWKVVAIPPNTKGPTHSGWNKEEGCLGADSTLPPDWGIGLCHAYSGTCALDIDEAAGAIAYFKERGIDLEELFNAPDNVAIDSGNPGHGKLIFAMPFGLSLPSKKIIIDGKVSFELRCGTANGLTVQDVLPPSRHPLGTTYRWAGTGNWQRLPTLPIAILNLWNDLIAKDTERNIPSAPNTTPTNWNELVSAVAAIDPDCSRDDWIAVGMGLQTTGNAEAFDLWDEWSSKGKKYKPAEMKSQWKSFKDKPNGVTVASIFKQAYAAGWKRPAPDISGLFGPVSAEPEMMMKKINVQTPTPVIDLSLWPPVLVDYAREVAQTVGCDPVVPLMAGLSAVCAVANKEIKAEINRTWSVSPLLWLMTVGDPSDKKSPGSRPMFATVRQIEREHVDEHMADMMFWQGMEAKVAGQMKAYREWYASAEAGMPNAVPPPVDKLPPEPKSLRLIINDATSQKMVHMSQGRPRGFLMLLDEMNHWLKKITDGRTGEDRGCWIQGYETGGYIMDRVGSGSISAENLAVAVYGNCQPTVFKNHMIAAADDGLVQRFIPVVLNGEHTGMWHEPLPDFLSYAPAYEAMLRQVFAMQVRKYALSPDAMADFRLFSNWHMKGQELARLLQHSPIYRTALGKIEGTCARLALLFHLMEHPHNAEISGATMRRATAVMKQFIVPSLRYAFMEIVGLKDELGKWVLEYIIQIANIKPTVTMGDIRRSAKRNLEGRVAWQADQEIRMVMDDLAEAGYVSLFVDHPKHTQWTINPTIAELFKDYRQAIILAKQQNVEHFQNVSAARGGSKPQPDAVGWTPEFLKP